MISYFQHGPGGGARMVMEMDGMGFGIPFAVPQEESVDFAICRRCWTAKRSTSPTGSTCACRTLATMFRAAKRSRVAVAVTAMLGGKLPAFKRALGRVADIDCIFPVQVDGQIMFLSMLDFSAGVRAEEELKVLLARGARVEVDHVSDALGRCLEPSLAFPRSDPHDLELAQLLVDAGADVNKTKVGGADGSNGTLDWYPRLVKAIEDIDGRAAPLMFLIENGADVNLCKDNGVGPLFKAAQRGFGNCVKVLIEAKADLNAISHTGATPLLIAASSSRNCVKLLLDAGADKSIVAHGDGHTAKTFTEKVLLENQAAIARAEIIEMLEAGDEPAKRRGSRRSRRRRRSSRRSRRRRRRRRSRRRRSRSRRSRRRRRRSPRRRRRPRRRSRRRRSRRRRRSEGAPRARVAAVHIRKSPSEYGPLSRAIRSRVCPEAAVP